MHSLNAQETPACLINIYNDVTRLLLYLDGLMSRKMHKLEVNSIDNYKFVDNHSIFDVENEIGALAVIEQDSREHD